MRSYRILALLVYTWVLLGFVTGAVVAVAVAGGDSTPIACDPCGLSPEAVRAEFPKEKP